MLRFFLLLYVTSLLASSASAQSKSVSDLCAGSYQETYQFDFGSGRLAYGPALGTIVAGYNYYSGGSALSDGKYALLKQINESLTNIGGWHDFAHDHTYWLTGKSDGYMLVVNAAFSKGEFFKKEVTGLCAGTDYIFSAYIANILRYGHCGSNTPVPKIKFKILEQGTYAEITSFIPPDVAESNASEKDRWVYQGFTFSIPASSSGNIVLVMENNSPGGCGNDLAIDDISFGICGPTITTNPTGKKTLCQEGESFQIAISQSKALYANPVYQWKKSVDGGTSWSNYGELQTHGTTDFKNMMAADAGLYKVLVAGNDATIDNIHCRIESNPIEINIYKAAKPILSSLSSICKEANVAITATPAGAHRYEWYVNDRLVSNPDLVNPQVLDLFISQETKVFVKVFASDDVCAEQSPEKIIVVETRAQAKIEVIGPVSDCLPTQIVLNDATIGKTTNRTWVVFDDFDRIELGAMSHAKKLIHIFNKPGKYSVRLLVGSSCSDRKTEDSRVIVIPPPPELENKGGILMFCENDAPITLSFAREITEVEGSGYYVGKGVTGKDQFDPSKAGIGRIPVSYIFKPDNGCQSVSMTVYFQVFAASKLVAAPILELIDGQTGRMEVTNRATVQASYRWSPAEGLSDPTILNPFVKATKSTQYTVQASFGTCATSLSVWVKVLPPLQIPNVITPNNDGLNDVLHIPNMANYPEAELFIYNRYGQCVWYAVGGCNNPWNGSKNDGRKVPLLPIIMY